jgi:short-subunit dehydrogenase
MMLRGAHALVTGASHGIGVCLAKELYARGARLTVLGRDEGRLAAVAEQVQGHALVADLADEQAVDGVLARAEQGHGPVDILINNAAFALVAAPADTKPGQARTMMMVNAIAPMELCRQALPGMLARGSGRVLNISSLAGVTAVPDMSLYCASKAALHHYTSVAQRDLHGTGVTMALVTLGEVAGTTMMEMARESPLIAAVSARLSRLMPVMTPETTARAIADVVAGDALVATIPKRLGAMVALRNLPSTLQDLAFIGLRD